MAKVAVRRSGLVTLPQNLLVSGPTLIEDFEGAAGWTAATGTVEASDATAHSGAGEFGTDGRWRVVQAAETRGVIEQW